MRGIAGQFPLDAATAHIVGRELAAHFKEIVSAPRFIIGRDTRESGAWLEAAFTAGAQHHCAGAVQCESAGVLPTPGIAFLTSDTAANAGIVISASHNPFQDNGIKIFTHTGRKLDEAIERRIEAAIYEQQANGKESAMEEQPLDVQTNNDAATIESLQRRYLDYLLKIAADLRLDNLRVVADCANGAAYKIAPALFQQLGAELHVINNQPDGRNINDDCGSLHLEGLQRAVLEKEADFGVAFDGDADRALFVDERGEIVDGDASLWILANQMLDEDKLAHRIVVATVMSNIGLERAFDKREIQMLRAPVGDKYVLEGLTRTGASLGGEQSGHIIFPRESLVGDGLRTTLHLLRAMRAKNSKLSELAREFVRYPQILINVKVRERRAFEDVPAIERAARQVESALGDEGRLLLRYSGTELLARVMIEGADEQHITNAARELAAIIENEIGA